MILIKVVASFDRRSTYQQSAYLRSGGARDPAVPNRGSLTARPSSKGQSQSWAAQKDRKIGAFSEFVLLWFVFSDLRFFYQFFYVT